MNDALRVRVLGAFTGLVCTVTACGGGGGGSPENVPALMLSANARVGTHLVDGSGRSLYYFGKDVPASGPNAAVSNCAAANGCAALWPSFHVGPGARQGINAQDVGEIVRSDGRQQTTYRGWPLYYYAGDARPGDINGEGIDDIWFVLRDRAYSVVLMSKSTGVNPPNLYVSDGAGRTLYQFGQDTAGTATSDPISACVDRCLVNWPIFLSEESIVPSALAASDFTVFTRPDGQRQSAYKGHPLYFFAGDTTAGDTSGRGVAERDTIDPRNLP
jgi:predicted lipoprotein with Yx(FWY)xxD motif